jgi:hypothetical protein
MHEALNYAVDDALSHREVLIEELLSVRCHDEGQAIVLEHVIAVLDGLLALVTCTVTHH